MFNPFQVSGIAPAFSQPSSTSTEKRGGNRGSFRSRGSTRGRGESRGSSRARGSSRGRGGPGRGAPSTTTNPFASQPPSTSQAFPSSQSSTLQFNEHGVPINNPQARASDTDATAPSRASSSQRGSRGSTRVHSNPSERGRGRGRGRGRAPRSDATTHSEAEGDPFASSSVANDSTSTFQTGQKRTMERRNPKSSRGGYTSQPRDEHSSRDKLSILPTEKIVKQIQGQDRGRSGSKRGRTRNEKPRGGSTRRPLSSRQEEDSDSASDENDESPPASFSITFQNPTLGGGQSDSEGSDDEHAEHEEASDGASSSSTRITFSHRPNHSEEQDSSESGQEDSSAEDEGEDTGPLRFLSSQPTPPSSPPRIQASLQRKSMRHVQDAMNPQALGSTFVPRSSASSLTPTTLGHARAWNPPTMSLIITTLPGQPNLQGTCTTKCSREEFNHRLLDYSFSPWERDPKTGDPSFDLTVAHYSRTASDTEEQVHKLRTPEALQESGEYLLHRIADLDRSGIGSSSYSFLSIATFMGDRFRAIHKEMTTQGFMHPPLVALLERAVRFLLVAIYRTLQSGDQSNTMEFYKLFTNAFLTLRDRAYPACHAAGLSCPNEGEMHSYFLLYQSHELVYQTMARPDLMQQAPLCLARQVLLALDARNYVQFFQLLRKCPLVMQCLIYARHVHKVRERALQVLAGAARGNRRATFLVSDLTRLLMMDDENQTILLMEQYGILPKGNEDEMFTWPSEPLTPLPDGRCLLSCRELTHDVMKYTMKYLAHDCPYLSSHTEHTTLSSPPPSRSHPPIVSSSSSPLLPSSPSSSTTSPTLPSPSPTLQAQQEAARRQEEEQARQQALQAQQQAEWERQRQAAREKQEQEEQAHRARMEATKKRQAQLEQQFQERQRAWEQKQQQERQAQHQVDLQVTQVHKATETYLHYLEQQAAEQELFQLRVDCVKRFLLARPHQSRLFAWAQWKQHHTQARAFQEAIQQRAQGGSSDESDRVVPFLHDPLPSWKDTFSSSSSSSLVSWSPSQWKARWKALMTPLSVVEVIGSLLAHQHPHHDTVTWKWSIGSTLDPTHPLEEEELFAPASWLFRKVRYVGDTPPHPPLLLTSPSSSSFPSHLVSVYQSSCGESSAPRVMPSCQVSVVWTQCVRQDSLPSSDTESEAREEEEEEEPALRGVQGMIFLLDEDQSLDDTKNQLLQFLHSHAPSSQGAKPLVLLHWGTHDADTWAQQLDLPTLQQQHASLLGAWHIQRVPTDIYGFVVPSAERVLCQVLKWQVEHMAPLPYLHRVGLVDVVDRVLDESVWSRYRHPHPQGWPHPQGLIDMYRTALECTYRTFLTSSCCPPTLDWPLDEFACPSSSSSEDMERAHYRQWNDWEQVERRLQEQLNRLMIPSLPDDVLQWNEEQSVQGARAYIECVVKRHPSLVWLIRYGERLYSRAKRERKEDQEKRDLLELGEEESDEEDDPFQEDALPSFSPPRRPWYPWHVLLETMIYSCLNAYGEDPQQVFYFYDPTLLPSRPPLQSVHVEHARHSLANWVEERSIRYVSLSSETMMHTEDGMDDDVPLDQDEDAAMEEESTAPPSLSLPPEEEEEESPPMKRQKRDQERATLESGEHGEFYRLLHTLQHGEAQLHTSIQQAIHPLPL